MTIKTTLVSDDAFNVVVRAHQEAVKELNILVENTIETIGAEYAMLYTDDVKDFTDDEKGAHFKGYVANFLETIRSEIYTMNVTSDESQEVKAQRILNVNRSNTIVAKLLLAEINEISIHVDMVVLDTYTAFYKEMKSQAQAQQFEEAKAWDCKLEPVADTDDEAQKMPRGGNLSIKTLDESPYCEAEK